MRTVRLGRTNLQVTKTAFGALPIQRVDIAASDKILKRAFEAGINFFDTARGYTDSEDKIGHALSGVRKDIIIATKSPSRDKQGVLADIDTSLAKLKTDWIDVLQLHNPAHLPDPEDPDSAYAGLVEAKKQGKIRFAGITCHKLTNALQAVKSGLYDTLQFPLSYLSSDEELDIIRLCGQYDMGLIVMKALSGGLITDAAAAFGFFEQYSSAVPIWGIQRLSELEEFIALEASPPPLDSKLQETICKDREQLKGSFCRGCGYCLPCPQDIAISMSARMSLLIKRAPSAQFLAPDWQEKMKRIETCTECGQCKKRCPYDLDIPELLKAELKKYQSLL